MEGIIAIISVFGFIPLIVFIVMFFRHRSHIKTADIIRTAIEHGQTPDEAFLKNLGIRQVRHQDLRTGIVALAVGVATMILGSAIAAEIDAPLHLIAGVTALPFLLGLVYIGFWYFMGRN